MLPTVPHHLHRPKPPLVSVVIPAPDPHETVARAIDSALAQTHPAVEVLVVQDASAGDARAHIVRRYRHEPRVRLIDGPGDQEAAAWNMGIATATGEYIGFLDPDDVWLPWKAELQVAYLRSTPDVGMVWTDFAAMTPDGAVFAHRRLRATYENMQGRRLGDLFDRRARIADAAPRSRPDLHRVPAYSGDVFTEMLLGALVHTPTVMIRSAVAAGVGPFDETLAADGHEFDYHLRTAQRTSVAFIDVPTTRSGVRRRNRLSPDRQTVAAARGRLRAVAARLTAAGDPRVSRHIARRALSDAHRSLGAALIGAGDRTLGRRHLRLALCHRPTPRAALRLARGVLSIGSPKPAREPRTLVS